MPEKNGVISIIINDPDGVGYFCWQPPEKFTKRLNELLYKMTPEQQKLFIAELKKLVQCFLLNMHGTIYLSGKGVLSSMSIFEMHLKNLNQDLIKIAKEEFGDSDKPWL